MLQADEQPRVEFTIEAEDERRAAVAAGWVCRTSTLATPSIVGGWFLVSLLANQTAAYCAWSRPSKSLSCVSSATRWPGSSAATSTSLTSK